MTTRAQLPHLQHFRVPNTWYGRLLLWAMRKYLGPQYRFILRGRIPIPARLRQHDLAQQLKTFWRDLAAGRVKADAPFRPRAYTDTQLRRIYASACPWRLAKEIGVYIEHTPKARKIMDAWTRQQRENERTYEESRIARIVQERMATMAGDRVTCNRCAHLVRIGTLFLPHAVDCPYWEAPLPGIGSDGSTRLPGLVTVCEDCGQDVCESEITAHARNCEG